MDLLLACALSVLQAVYAIEYFVTDRVVSYEGAPVIPGTYDNKTALQCQAYCNLNANCSSFSYCGSSCYLKQACIAEWEPLENATTYTGNCVTWWKTCEALRDYQVTPRLVLEQGTEIENVVTDDLGACAAACNGNPQCNSFSFYAPSRGCHLKAKCVESTDALVPEQQGNAVYRTFYKCCGCTTSTTTSTMSPWLSLNRSLANEGAGATPGIFMGTYSVGDCQSYCDANPTCNSFTYCGTSCYLKELCVLEQMALTPEDGWNGCVTHYKPCSTTTTTTTSTTTTTNETTSLTMESTQSQASGSIPDAKHGEEPVADDSAALVDRTPRALVSVAVLWLTL